jgi:YVTN family beta-propeller protein
VQQRNVRLTVMSMRSRLHLHTAVACLGIIAAAASLLAMAPAQAHRTGHAPAGASPHVLTAIPVGRQPDNVAVDPVTDMIYVTEPAQYQVIDGKTNTIVATVHMPSPQFSLAVDPVTDMIYATDPSQLGVQVIDGTTNTEVALVRLGAAGYYIATNPVTDRIYVQARPLRPHIHVAVINGQTNKVLTRVPSGAAVTEGIATDPQTNMIYAATFKPNAVVAINGQTNTVAATITGVNPLGVATDPQTDTVYATEPEADGPGAVYVINGQTNTLTTAILGGFPEGIATDPRTDFAYAADIVDNDVMVIDGKTNTVTATVPVGKSPKSVAADAQTNRIYVTNTGSRSVSVLAGAG